MNQNDVATVNIKPDDTLTIINYGNAALTVTNLSATGTVPDPVFGQADCIFLGPAEWIKFSDLGSTNNYQFKMICGAQIGTSPGWRPGVDCAVFFWTGNAIVGTIG